MGIYRKTKSEMLQEFVEDYRKKYAATSVSLPEVAAWAIRENKWSPEPRSAIKMLTEQLSSALREQYLVDEQGRKVRRKHAQRIWTEVSDGKREQLVLWHDITEATRPQMQAAFQQRRQGIVMDCRQLKVDVDSFNDNHNKSVPIQIVFNFEEDLEELEMGDDEDNASD